MTSTPLHYFALCLVIGAWVAFIVFAAWVLTGGIARLLACKKGKD